MQGLNLKRAYAPNWWYCIFGIFVILLSQDGFESKSLEKSPKQSLPKVTSEAAICRGSSKQVFLEISQYLQEITFK